MEKLDSGWASAPAVSKAARQSVREIAPSLERPAPKSPQPQELPISVEKNADHSHVSTIHKEALRVLKAEKDLQSKIETRTKELLEREYTTPTRPIPCVEERRRCVECYRKFPDDPSKCAPHVEDFSRCAAEKLRSAWAEERQNWS